MRAVHAVAGGDVIVSRVVAEPLLDAVSRRSARSPMLTELTRRETEILELLASGLPTGAIAHRLDLTAKTVRNHISNILAKLGAVDRVDAVLRAREQGFGNASR